MFRINVINNEQPCRAVALFKRAPRDVHPTNGRENYMVISSHARRINSRAFIAQLSSLLYFIFKLNGKCSCGEPVALTFENLNPYPCVIDTLHYSLL